mgnify:CR=1 FL=1
MNTYQTNFFAFCPEVINNFLACLSYRSHCNDNIFGFRIAIISKWLVVPARKLSDISHILIYDIGDGFVKPVY